MKRKSKRTKPLTRREREVLIRHMEAGAAKGWDRTMAKVRARE